MQFDEAGLREALGALGRLLERRGQHFDVVVVGGSALLLSGFVTRPTIDVDVVAIATSAGLVKASPLPEPLVHAVEDIAAQLDLPATWLNAGPADLMDWGLPEGFAERLRRRSFGGLVVALAERFDLICFKLYAFADQGPTSRHYDDLRALEPSSGELEEAAVWCRTQDPSEGFVGLLAAALRLLEAE
ncbi:MAG: DUF6036 family nucleotidyltransferase [Egibacteraceae bacterium]